MDRQNVDFGLQMQMDETHIGLWMWFEAAFKPRTEDLISFKTMIRRRPRIVLAAP
jgi:hypothetical protein